MKSKTSFMSLQDVITIGKLLAFSMKTCGYRIIATEFV